MKAIKTSRDDKKVRAEVVTTVIESGKVLLPQRARWLGDFLYEMSVFPSGLCSDQVDTLSLALSYLKGRSNTERTEQPSFPRVPTGRSRFYEPEERDEPDGSE